MSLEAKTKTIEVLVSKKPEGEVDPNKVSKDFNAPDANAEVEGHGIWRWVECWHCGSMRHVYWEYPGEVFTCGNCGYDYVPVSI